MQLLVLSTSQLALCQAYRQAKQTDKPSIQKSRADRQAKHTDKPSRQTAGGEKRRKKSKISTNLIAYSVSELANHYLDLPSETSFDENIKCIKILNVLKL